MNHDERKLKRQLQEMQLGHEARKQRKKDARIARAARRGADETPFDARAVLNAESDALEEIDLEARWRQRARRAAPPRRPADAGEGPRGRVSAIASGIARVRLLAAPQHEVHCRLAPSVARAQRERLAVGDEVRLSERGGVPRIEEILPRRTCLARRDPSNPHLERVLAANVDLVLVATAVLAPGVKPGLIDRVMLAARDAGCDAAICVNKVDLAEGSSEGALQLGGLDAFAESGVRVLRCSARTGEGLAELAAALREKTSVLVGQSGCGKTSLLNALAPGLDLATAPSRASDGKGRHTTTGSNLHPLPGGGFLIDTPGVRQFGLWRPSAESLAAGFPTVAAAATRCRFGDCTHEAEPGCAVRRALAAGELEPHLVARFLRLCGDV